MARAEGVRRRDCALQWRGRQGRCVRRSYGGVCLALVLALFCSRQGTERLNRHRYGLGGDSPKQPQVNAKVLVIRHISWQPIAKDIAAFAAEPVEREIVARNV